MDDFTRLVWGNQAVCKAMLLDLERIKAAAEGKTLVVIDLEGDNDGPGYLD